MNYGETLEYLYKALPMFHRVGAAAYKANLDNTRALCRLLGNPEKTLRCVHVAGTNGKGSTSHMLAAILQAAGYKTGLYTSPHLRDFRERIRINGRMIPRTYVASFVTRYRNDFDRIRPSFFEMTVALCLAYFRDSHIDVAVIETGLGGRLDSTNVVNPDLSLITNIGWDHMNLLGDTLEKIAAEKAGIIKPGIPVVIGESLPETRTVFENKAMACRAPLYFAEEKIRLRKRKNGQFIALRNGENPAARKQKPLIITPGLKGIYQEKNLRTVITASVLLRDIWDITDEHIRKGIADVVSMTGLRGRWEVLYRRPLVIADAGHNPDGVRYVVKQLRSTPHQRMHMVIGMVDDKDVTSVLKLLPKKAEYYFCQAEIPRAMAAEKLSDLAIPFRLKGKVIPKVSRALHAAITAAGSRDLVFVGCSTFVVAEALRCRISKPAH